MSLKKQKPKMWFYHVIVMPFMCYLTEDIQSFVHPTNLWVPSISQAICKGLRILKETGKSRSLIQQGPVRISVFGPRGEKRKKKTPLKGLTQEKDGINLILQQAPPATRKTGQRGRDRT